jgi:hypothetical protein
MTQDAILGTSTSERDYSRFGAVKPRTASWDIFSRPWRDWFVRSNLPSTHVLGYSQPSLRDSIWKGWFSHRL